MFFKCKFINNVFLNVEFVLGLFLFRCYIFFYFICGGWDGYYLEGIRREIVLGIGNY